MTTTTEDPPFVDFRDVWLAYNDELRAANQFAVEAIDLQVRRGEFIAIVGPSGCGKSTFMKLATGLRMPSMGRIRIDGQPVTGPLKISGMAFQAPSLLPWRSTVDNVLLPLEIVEPHRSQFKARRKEYEERARALLQKVGLAGYEDKYPWQLSGGMQQRASICRALIHEPKMLLLDEPFGALDALTRGTIQDELMAIVRQTQQTVFMITHDVDEAILLADCILLMSNGSDTPQGYRPGGIAEVVANPLPRERTRTSLHHLDGYYALRNHIVDFLVSRAKAH
jgi:NitT/TauT family transport system ATP-binding protein